MTHSVALEWQKGLLQFHKKMVIPFYCLLGDFRLKQHGGGGNFTPTPLPGQGLHLQMMKKY